MAGGPPRARVPGRWRVTTEFVCMFSGGVGSWAAAKKIAAEVGPNNLTLLFADTRIEDPDLYRFLEEGAAAVGSQLVRIADGRTPWEVFRDERMLGNSRVAPCSKLLKQVPARRWMQENAPSATVVLGIDWTEQHRLPGAVEGWRPWKVRAPLCEEPWQSWRTKSELLADLAAEGIRPPALYSEGFPHNNCGGGCVRAGSAQFVHLLNVRPETFAEWEAGEEEMRSYLGRAVAILRDRRGGTTRPLPLSELRAREMQQPGLFADEDWGGCGCFLASEPEVAKA